MAAEHHLEDAKIGKKEHHHETPIRRRRKKTGNMKPMRFVSLHHHSTFSYKDGFQLPEAHVRRAQELQMPGLAMTEHGNVSSHVKFEKALKDSGVKGIFGCEVYTGKVGPEATQSKYHLTLLAKNQTGYQNLLKLVSLSYSVGFHYDPTISWEMLNDHKDGLIVLSGCQGSLLFCSAVGGKLIKPEDASYERALRVARRFKAAFGRDYFIEVQAFPELEPTRQANPMLARIARKLGVRLVATMDCHYTELEEAEMQMILHNIRGGNKKSVEEQAREWGYDVPLCPPPNDMSIFRRLRGTGLSKDEALQAIVSTEEIAQECDVTLPRLDMVRFPIPAGFKSVHEFWEHKLREGWRRAGFHKLKGHELERRKKQLAHEKKIIEDKGFIDYMLIVSDALCFIKDQNIPVWLRGSAAASIVCYLLRISDFDPMTNPMVVFERFIDVTREDLPDVDADFPSEARPMLRDYLVKMYGQNCVNNLGTFTYYKSKLALDDVARVYRIPKFKIEQVKDYLIERSSGDLRASSTIEDTIAEFEQPRQVFEEHPELYKSFELEGNIKGHGVHAAGLVISNDDIREVSSVLVREMPKGSGRWVEVLGVDKYDAEYLGMVKMDFLGLSTMSQLWACLRYLDMSLTDLFKIPFDDEKVFDAFRRNDVVGIFQFDGRACRYVTGAVQPDNLWEVCDVTALARPGALHNGAAREYAEIKHGRAKARSIHPLVDEILGPTKSQIIYQEQILRLVSEVGAFDYTKAAEIRRIIAKKHGEQAFNRRRDQFLAGAATIHERSDHPPLARAAALDLWGEMITSGSYGFNAAHAWMYGVLGYYSMWIKVHFPEVYYATALAYLSDQKRHDLLRDAAKKGFRVLPPEPAIAGATWEPLQRSGRDRAGRPRFKRRVIRAGFQQIDGIAEKTANVIIDHRERNGLKNWHGLLDIKGIGPKTIEKIIAWAEQDDPFGAFALDGNIKKIKSLIASGEIPGLPEPTHTAHDLPYDKGPNIEVVWLGTILERNIRDIFEQNRAKKGVELRPDEVKDPHLNEWAMLTCEDETDQLLLRIDRWKYPQMKKALFDFQRGKDLLLVQGIRPGYVTSRQINIKRMWVIDPSDD